MLLILCDSVKERGRSGGGVAVRLWRIVLIVEYDSGEVCDGGR